MDLRWSESDEQFRAELRSWMADALPKLGPPAGPDDWEARRERDTRWQGMLFEGGYAGINWPREYGGRGASLSEQLVFYEETTQAGAPLVGVNFVGLLHAGPTLIAEATPEQQAAHLPAILKGEEVWCQGFSEPSAGSDLASLRTRAVRDGDEYVITGQKIWTSYAQVSDYCELLVRTDPDAPKHRGITWLMLPMNTPGVEVRPLRTARGSSEFSELFLDSARVPVANRVGPENDGWRVAMVTFSFERGTSLVPEMVDARRQVERLVDLATVVSHRSTSAWDDAALRRDIGHVAAELDALWNLVKRTVSEAARTGVPGVGGSVVKLYYTELRQRIGDLSLKVLDRAALSLDDVYEGSGRFVEERLRTLALTIAAGSSQIQRNIIAERILGLPKGA
jgi:alkylation response protein AidB-like acyl-CoA dehydrogenase